jgi:plastocyanin
VPLVVQAQNVHDVSIMLRAVRFAWGTHLACVMMAASIAMAGCTSLHRVPMVPSAQAPAEVAVKAGDTVRVTLRDGTRTEFIVGKVNADAIVARNGDAYDAANIVTLERRQFSGRKTILLLLGIPVGVFGFAMLAFALSGK